MIDDVKAPRTVWIIGTANVHQQPEPALGIVAQPGQHRYDLRRFDLDGEFAKRNHALGGRNSSPDMIGERLQAICHASTLQRTGAANLPLQQHDAVHQCLSGWWTSRYVDINRYDAITAANHGIRKMVIAAAIRA